MRELTWQLRRHWLLLAAAVTIVVAGAVFWREIVGFVLLIATLRLAWLRLAGRRAGRRGSGALASLPKWIEAASFAWFAAKYERPRRERIRTKPEPVYRLPRRRRSSQSDDIPF